MSDDDADKRRQPDLFLPQCRSVHRGPFFRTATPYADTLPRYLERLIMAHDMSNWQQLSRLIVAKRTSGFRRLCYLGLYKVICLMFVPEDPEKTSEAYRLKCLDALGCFCYQNPASTSIQHYRQYRGLVEFHLGW